MTTDTMNLPSVYDSLSAYMSEVNKLPVLSQEKEYELATRLVKTGDREAARELVLSHLRYVVHCARQYSGYGLNMSDIIQEGNIGLMVAVKKFDPTRGVRLVTYATHWIASYIRSFIISNWSIVKIATTKAQRKLFFHKERLSPTNEKESAETIAKDLNVTPAAVEDMRNRLAFAGKYVVSGATDAMNKYQSGGESDDLEIQIADESPNIEEEVEKDYEVRVLYSCIEELPELERQVFKARRLSEDPPKLRELAQQLGVSHQRIAQLESAAMDKISIMLKQRIKYGNH